MSRREGPGSFDRFADDASRLTSRATFFTACLVLCMLWLPSWFLIRDVATWQLIMVTVTNVATFLMVALVQNAQWRNQVAMNRKLDAAAAALASVVSRDDEASRRHREALEEVVALEERV